MAILVSTGELIVLFVALELVSALLVRTLMALLKRDLREDYESRYKPRWAVPSLVFGIVWPWLDLL